MLEKLKKKYDSKTITAIEKTIDISRNSEAKFQHDRIMVLYYLQRTSRYKENKMYKNSNFGEYLFDRHGMRIGTFNSHRLMIFNNLKHVKKYGIGVVKKIYIRCGAANMPFVLAALDNAKVKTRLDIEKIILKHAKPKQKKTGPTVSQLQAEIIAKDQIIADQRKIIEDQAEQIKKLKATIRRKGPDYPSEFGVVHA